jgi:hypothetical protein
LIGIRLKPENPLAARELDAIDLGPPRRQRGMKLCHNGKPTGPSSRWSRLRADGFYANKPTTTSSGDSTKRTHGARNPVENRENEPTDGPEKLTRRISTNGRQIAEEMSGCKARRAVRPGPQATAPWAVPLWSGPLNSKRHRKAFLIFKIGDGCPRKNAKKRQKAPFYRSSNTFRGACALPRQGLGKTLLPASVPLNSGIMRKAFMIHAIGDEALQEPCQLVPNSATRSRQCKYPASAGSRSETLELFSHSVAYCPVHCERCPEGMAVPMSKCTVMNIEVSPDRSCGIQSSREVDYGAGVKQLGFEISGESIRKEGFS